jgi:glucose-6-phosphate 1-dehydrogenase
MRGHNLQQVSESIDVLESGPACSFERLEEPVLVVIFGATGDLTWRKIFPALYALYATRVIPQEFCLVGCARTELSNERFREMMRQSVQNLQSFDPVIWEGLENKIFYVPLAYDSAASFDDLFAFLKDLDQQFQTQGNKLLYLSVPPSVYQSIVTCIGQTGLSREYQSGQGWVRCVIEKPFGRDLETARDLDQCIHSYFEEHQVFRIDHYLAKETVQNILMLRFANSIFEPIWDRRYIDYVQITAAEQIGVGHRAGYYDQFGVLRDMFQNHMMQLLALCAMEPPSIFQADRVRDEKTKVYRSLRPFPVDQLEDSLVLGQYASGVIDGEKVAGYLDEFGVDPNSVTPTFASMKVFVDNWRWQGVPFYLTSGKRLAEKRTEIFVQFKHVPYSMFRGVLSEEISANRLILGIQPKEEVSLNFQTKIPGPKVCLRTVHMEFDYHQGFSGTSLEAYEKVLLDCLLGDQTLFWRQDGVELCWGFLTPILKECDCPERAEQLHIYRAGTWGPQAIKRFLPENLRHR